VRDVGRGRAEARFARLDLALPELLIPSGTVPQDVTTVFLSLVGVHQGQKKFTGWWRA
jgi:hypothetical protein